MQTGHTGNIGLSMRPSSGSGALTNAGQMMMQSSNKKVSQNQVRSSQNSFSYQSNQMQQTHSQPMSMSPAHQFFVPPSP